jgi:hypothetical protein
MTGENKNGVMDPAADPRIDAALHVIGSATPESGLEGRILTRLAEERLRMEAAPAPSVRAAWLGHFPVRALGLVTACLMGFVIVTGSVVHSRRIKPDQMVSPPPLVLPAQGIGAASAVHPAAPASAPILAGQPGRAARRSSPGRARIAPHARKAPGVAVPAPSSNKSSSSDSQN